MKLTLDFTKARPTAKQIEFACEIHKRIFDRVDDRDFAKICGNSARMTKYLTAFAPEYRKWWFAQNHELQVYRYHQLLRACGISIDPEF